MRNEDGKAVGKSSGFQKARNRKDIYIKIAGNPESLFQGNGEVSFESIESIPGKPPRWGWNGFRGVLPRAEGYTGEMTLPSQLSQVLRKIVLILVLNTK